MRVSAVIDQRVRVGNTNDFGSDDPYRSRVDARPELAERVDPVVYSSTAPAAGVPISQAQVEQYDRNGFLEIDNLWSPAELAWLQTEAERLRMHHDGIDPHSLILEPERRELRSVFRIHAQSAVFSRLASDSRLVAIARHLLGDDVYVHQSRLNYKPGFFGKEFYWHSDFETWHIEDGMPRMRALSMSILLTENTEYNGPLMIIPGSHRRYVRCVGETPEDHYKQSLRRQEYGVPDPECLQSLFEQGGIATSHGLAGKVIIFDCNAMHGSNSNISPLPRSNIFLVYNSMTNRVRAPYSGQKPRPEFIATRDEIKAIEAIEGSLT